MIVVVVVEDKQQRREEQRTLVSGQKGDRKKGDSAMKGHDATWGMYWR